MNLIHRLGLPFWSILIAIVLWVQVHGQGMGSVRLDVALQVRDVPADMVIVNDLPDQVSITVFGLQALLNSLDTQALFVSVDASSLRMPGVIEQALDVEAIDLPAGLKVEKIQPDSVQLQVDHIVKRTIEVQPMFDLPQGWSAEHVVITPSVIDLSGPEVWLSTIEKIETSALRLDLKQGLFDVETTVVPLSGKGIHTLKKDVKIRVRGDLVWKPAVQNNEEVINAETLLDTENTDATQDDVSIVPVPANIQEDIQKGVQETTREQAVQIEPVTQPVKTSIVPILVDVKNEQTIQAVQPEIEKKTIENDSIVPIPKETYSAAQELKLEAVVVEPVVEDVYANANTEQTQKIEGE